jgi:hypothetical protein
MFRSLLVEQMPLLGKQWILDSETQGHRPSIFLGRLGLPNGRRSTLDALPKSLSGQVFDSCAGPSFIVGSRRQRRVTGPCPKPRIGVKHTVSLLLVSRSKFSREFWGSDKPMVW